MSLSLKGLGLKVETWKTPAVFLFIMTLTSELEENINGLKEYVEYFPDFPKPGILYKDVFGLFNHEDGIQLLAKILKQVAFQLCGKVDCIAMLDSRGFMIAPMIALHLNVPCIPVCKKGKLPGPVVDLSYDLEYGKDTLEIQLDSIKQSQKVLLVDDFLATGGTLEAASKLIKMVGGNVVQGLVLMEKCDLEGRKKLNFPLICLLSD